MKPKILKVKNYAGYNEETFNYEEAPDLFAIVGENGAGKSSFFVDAVTICLFNQCRTSDSRGSGVEHMIQKNKEHFEIEFTFELNNQTIRVIRKRYEKKQELELFIDDIEHTEKIKETQEKINNLIKMDYDTFLDTVCIGQGKSSSFMEKKPDKRKEVFTKVLNLDKYDVLEEEAKELRKKAKNEILRFETQLQSLEDSVQYKERYETQIINGDLEIAKIQNEIIQFDELLEKELIEKATHEQLVKSVNEIVSKKNSILNSIANLELSINKGEQVKESLESKITEKSSIDDKLSNLALQNEELQDEMNKLSNDKSSLQGKNELYTKQAKDLKGKFVRLKDFNEADCEFCGQQVTESHKSKHLTQMETEAKGLLRQINENKTLIEEIEIKLNNVKNLFSKNRSLINELQSSKSNIMQAEAKLPGVISRLEELSEELEKNKEELEKVSSVYVEKVENKIFNDNEYRMKLNTLRSQLSQYNTQIGIAKNELIKIQDDVVKIKDIEKKVKEEKKKLVALEDLVTAFGKKGIQAIIIDNSLSEIQIEINEFLSKLDGKMTIDFITQKDKGTGKKVSSIETLDIIVNDENGSRIYESYSGGEKFRIDFACHVGLAKFLAKRAGSPVDFFILDEGIGSQDQAAKDNFISAVNKLTTFFSKVMVITHIPDIIAAFDNKVEVYKDVINGSKIRIGV